MRALGEIEYVVTVSYTAEFTAKIKAPPDVTRDELREMALGKVDDGEEEFETVAAETIVRYMQGVPIPLHLLAQRLQSPL